MKFGKNNQITTILDSLANLTSSDAVQSNPEAAAFFARLAENRTHFEEVFDQLIESLMQISSLDLQMHHAIDQLTELSHNVADTTAAIHGVSNETSGVATSVSHQHEELTNTIIAASEESSNVYKMIESGQNELTQIKELSQSTIVASEEMKQDMDQLSDVINRMNEVIEGINSISSQTNLLSLNASIEAARAGEAGRGFAVVADEIRDLANETQKLTQNMGGFVEGVKEASKKSVASATNTITALETMTEKIGNVWNINEENQRHVADISNDISSLAAVSEEISSSMIELETQANEIQSSCSTLDQNSADFLSLGKSLTEAVKPIAFVETALDGVAKNMRHLTEDPLYHLDKKDFVSYFDKAITAHKNWLNTLGNIVDQKTILPLQVDDTKCGFGHFYCAMNPQYPEIKETWKALGPKHKKFHNYGSQIIRALFDEDYNKADSLYREAVSYSSELIRDLESMKSALK